MAVNPEVVHEHIKACLKIGSRKLESAKLLKEGKRFEDAISPYVKAYEELGQAAFFKESYSKNPEITENEWKILVKPGSHTSKIIAFYIGVKNSLQNMSEEAFNTISKSYVGQSFLYTGNKDILLNDVKMKIKIFDKLDKLRQRFDHSHNLDGTIVKYNERDLESFCELLEFECLKSYYSALLWLDYNKSELPRNSPDEAIEEMANKISYLPSMSKLKELDRIGTSVRMRKHRTRGLLFIDSFKIS